MKKSWFGSVPSIVGVLITGMKVARKGTRLAITFNVDANMMMTIRIKDLETRSLREYRVTSGEERGLKAAGTTSKR
jgi:hypothetical protein